MSEGGKGVGDLAGLGAWATPVDTFIKRLSALVGGVLEPKQIKRIALARKVESQILAKGEANAMLTLAEAQVAARKIQIVGEMDLQDEVQRRMLTRVMLEESRNQVNIESIAAQAIPLIDQEAKPEQMDQEWLENFVKNAKSVSSEQMQHVWAHILANEANKPGSFSKRTINLVSSIDKSEAASFVALCRFCWRIGPAPIPLVFDLTDTIYSTNGVTLTTLNHLDSIGLINHNSMVFGLNCPKPIAINYFGTWIGLESPNEKLQVGHVLLTTPGEQLAPICNALPVPGFIEHIIAKWEKQGITVNRSPAITSSR